MTGEAALGGERRRRLGRVHFPRISTHLLRLLHVDKRGRQPLDCHKLQARSAADAENNAVVATLLIRHACGLRVDGDAIRAIGPAAYHGLRGGCKFHSAVHFNCSSSSVSNLHTRARSCPPPPSSSPSPAPAPQSPSRHTGQKNLKSLNPFTSTSPTVGGKSLLQMIFPWPPADLTSAAGIAPLHRHKRVVVFAQLQARVRARGGARRNSCARIIAAIG